MAGFFSADLVLDLKDHFQRIVAEIREALHRPILLEVLPLLGTPGDEVRVERTDQLLHLRQVILVLAPVLAGLGVEEQVASEHFVHHAAEGPEICCFVVALAQDDLRRSILSSLYLTREVVVLPAGVAQVCDLYPEGSLELVASVETDLAFLGIEQFLETVVLDLAEVLALSFVLFLPLPSQLLLQVFLLGLAQLPAFELLLQLV